eukprot:15431249-Alexandrium_andersonii.AAC.1
MRRYAPELQTTMTLGEFWPPGALDRSIPRYAFALIPNPATKLRSEPPDIRNTGCLCCSEDFPGGASREA